MKGRESQSHPSVDRSEGVCAGQERFPVSAPVPAELHQSIREGGSTACLSWSGWGRVLRSPTQLPWCPVSPLITVSWFSVLVLPPPADDRIEQITGNKRLREYVQRPAAHTEGSKLPQEGQSALPLLRFPPRCRSSGSVCCQCAHPGTRSPPPPP